jgi:hypothetical protein
MIGGERRWAVRRALEGALDAISVAAVRARKWLSRAGFPPAGRRGRRVACGPSGSVRSLRTHVPFTADICTRPARARRVPAHPLAPSARGRRSRRLGGRPERASRRSSMPGAAARAQRSRAAAADGSTPSRAAGLREPRESERSVRAGGASCPRMPVRGLCAPTLRARVGWLLRPGRRRAGAVGQSRRGRRYAVSAHPATSIAWIAARSPERRPGRIRARAGARRSVAIFAEGRRRVSVR